MNAKELEKLYGAEYPKAVTMFDIRMPLINERRFARFYSSQEPKLSTEVSRFSDGSASISLEELRENWSSWPLEDKRDFCSACGELHEHRDFPDKLRFVMSHGDMWNWSSVANLVSYALPMEEAFLVLKAALDQTSSMQGNLIQAIALTKHPNAAPLIREHVAQIWTRAGLWADDSFLNWTAEDAIHSIEHLIELGDNPADYEDKVRSLAEHVCAGNRDSCSRWLHQYYDWIPAPPSWQPPGSPNPSS
jgi:hypothetical protein